MLHVLYADEAILVAEKPVGVESQSARRFEPDMVSEIKKYLVINRLCTPGREPYVGVIHRLDKPVPGVMVYARTKNAAGVLSTQLQNHQMEKEYEAVVCGKPVNTVENLVDYLKKSVDGNRSFVVDKGITGAKPAKLSCRAIQTITEEEQKSSGIVTGISCPLTLVRIRLETGRHHQIRVQLASHGLPLYGDSDYNPMWRKEDGGRNRELALCAVSLSFAHPVTGKRMRFEMEPAGRAFSWFSNREA